MRSRHLLRVVRDDHRDRYDEMLAEVAPRIPGYRVGHLADEIFDVFVAGIGFLHAHQQDGEHAARRGEINDAFAGAGDAYYPGVLVSARLAVRDQVGRSDRSRLLRGGFEVIRRSFDKRSNFCFFEHPQASASSSSNASLSCRSVNGLQRNPLAPFSIASTAVALSARAETTKISTLELIAINSSTHSMPSISGMVKSIVTTSGCVRRNISTAARPLLAAPTTSRRAICWERSMRRRMMFESSTIMSFKVPLGTTALSITPLPSSPHV